MATLNLFGFGNNKKKNAELKTEILKEIGRINAPTAALMKEVVGLEEMVKEHLITGDKSETKALDKLLGQVQYYKQCVNTGKDSSAKTAFDGIVATISNEWKDSEKEGKFKIEKDNQFDLDTARDELKQKLKKQEELRKFLTENPDKQAFYSGDWNVLYDEIEDLKRAIADYNEEKVDKDTLKRAEDTHERNAKIEKRNKVSDAQVQALQNDLAKDQAKKEARRSSMDSLRGTLNQNSESQSTLRGFGEEQSGQTTLRGFEATGTAAASTSTPIGIEQAMKKADENLAKLEAQVEDLEDSISDLDREYQRHVDNLKKMLAKRAEMSPAEYNTIDYKIDKEKVDLQLTQKKRENFQNALAQANLKKTMLELLKTERDLTVLNRYNIDEMSIDDIAAYISTKNGEKNANLENLDEMTATILGDKVNTSTGTADALGEDLSGINTASEDKYDELKALLGM